MNPLFTSTVFVLVVIEYNRTLVVGVFASNSRAVRYATENDLLGWEVLARGLAE